MTKSYRVENAVRIRMIAKKPQSTKRRPTTLRKAARIFTTRLSFPTLLDRCHEVCARQKCTAQSVAPRTPCFGGVTPSASGVSHLMRIEQALAVEDLERQSLDCEKYAHLVAALFYPIAAFLSETIRQYSRVTNRSTRSATRQRASA